MKKPKEFVWLGFSSQWGGQVRLEPNKKYPVATFGEEVVEEWFRAGLVQYVKAADKEV